jgi:hypothetical protein
VDGGLWVALFEVIAPTFVGPTTGFGFFPSPVDIGVDAHGVLADAFNGALLKALVGLRDALLLKAGHDGFDVPTCEEFLFDEVSHLIAQVVGDAGPE